jgi:hypothetical protein
VLANPAEIVRGAHDPPFQRVDIATRLHKAAFLQQERGDPFVEGMRTIHLRFLAPLVAIFSVGTAAADTYTVVSTVDSGPGSLRQAILDANSHTGADTIAFNIPGTGVRTITPLTELPSITSPVTIDGYTQPGSVANTATTGDNAVILIELNGTNAGASANGLTLGPASGGSIIKGLVMNRFGGNGVSIQSNSNTISGNFIGPDASGTAALGNSLDGISVQASSNTIGGTIVAARNIVSGNGRHGISLAGGAQNNQVQMNFVGTNFSGTQLLGNGGDGVFATAATNNLIGGTLTRAGNPPVNVIAGNASCGVGAATGVTGLTIKGNSIHSNGGLGIDLNRDGPTLNDISESDADTGPNNLQNYPILTVFHAFPYNGGSDVHFNGRFKSRPNTTYHIEYFSNDAYDPTGFGEGQVFVGSHDFTTPENGRIGWATAFQTPMPVQNLTMTATDQNGNTSEFSPEMGQLQNIATRLRVQTGDNVLIGGFIISGTDPKKVMVRGIGPSLANHGISDPLEDPTLEVHDNATTLATNDDWKLRPDNSSQQAEIEATLLAPTNDKESAVVTTLPANNSGYTAVLRGKNNSTGIGVVEAYDLDSAANSRLANISTRGLVESGDHVLIGGIIPSTGLTKVIVRAIGPTLTGYGITNPLLDPTLELYDDSGTVVATNDDWQTTQKEDIEEAHLEPSDSRESAIFANLRAGNYTAVVRGKNGTTGIAVVEAYNVAPGIGE